MICKHTIKAVNQSRNRHCSLYVFPEFQQGLFAAPILVAQAGRISNIQEFILIPGKVPSSPYGFTRKLIARIIRSFYLDFCAIWPVEAELNGKKGHASIEEGHSAGKSWNLNVGMLMKSWNYVRIYLSPDGCWSYHWNIKVLQEPEPYFIKMIIVWNQ